MFARKKYGYQLFSKVDGTKIYKRSTLMETKISGLPIWYEKEENIRINGKKTYIFSIYDPGTGLWVAQIRAFSVSEMLDIFTEEYLPQYAERIKHPTRRILDATAKMSHIQKYIEQFPAPNEGSWILPEDEIPFDVKWEKWTAKNV